MTMLPTLFSSANALPIDEPQIDSSELSLEELMEFNIARVSTASRHEQRVTEAPAAVTIITADDIKKNGHRTLADIVKSVPGFYVSYDRNYSYLGSRGFGRPGDYNSRILLLIDGHRLNDNIYDTAAIGTEFPLDVDLIDHVEFVRGPGSSLFGSNAFFGIINVFTRSSTDVSREISVTAGDNETFGGRLSYGKDIGKGSLLLSGSLLDSAGQQKLYYPEYAAAPSGPVARNNDFDSSKSFYARLAYGDLILSGLYHTRDKGIPTGSFGTAFNSKPNETSDDRGYTDLTYRHRLGDAGEITARVYYDAYVYNGTYTYDKLGGRPYVANKDNSIGRWWGAETVATFTPFKDHHVSLGAEFRDNLSMSQTNYDETPYTSFLDDNHRSRNWALFAQDEYRMFKKLRLNVGFRYDNFDRYDAINPRAALIFQPAAATIFKLVYGEAFRAPNPYELYYNDAGSTSKANPDLKPEKIRTYEAIWEQYYGKTYNSSVSGFYYRINNLISQTIDASDNLLVFQNLDKIEAMGVETALQANWENGFKGRLSYSWQEAKNLTSGSQLYNSPRHLAKANISIPVYRELVFVSPEFQYMSSRLTLTGNHTRDAMQTNLTLYSHDLIKGLEASASIYNLFDSRYSDPGANEHLQDSIPQDGMNFRIKLVYRF